MLIACEGISGSGKSKIVSQLFEQIAAQNEKITIVEWNSNPLIRNIINKLYQLNILSSNIYSLLQWGGFLNDYFRKILPLLKKGYIIIADRYIYTGLTRDAMNRSNRFMGRLISRYILKPDILLFNDTDLEVCYFRIKMRGKPLFHTNQRILQNKVLKNKDLYYLRKMQFQYTKLLNDPNLLGNTNVFIVNRWCDISQLIEFYMSIKRKRMPFINLNKRPDEEVAVCSRNQSNK